VPLQGHVGEQDLPIATKEEDPFLHRIEDRRLELGSLAGGPFGGRMLVSSSVEPTLGARRRTPRAAGNDGARDQSTRERSERDQQEDRHVGRVYGRESGVHLVFPEPSRSVRSVAVPKMNETSNTAVFMLRSCSRYGSDTCAA
jgi:hypothetical protein